MYCASLPREVHARDLVDKELCRYYNSSKQFGKRKRPGRAMMVPPCPLNERDSFNEFTEMCICRSGIHTHCMTCHKPPRGITGCRLCRPAGMVSSTAPVQLMDVTSEEKEEEEDNACRKKQKIEYEVLQQNEICPPAQEIVTQHHDIQVELPDSRLIVWEIKRPSLPGLPTPPKNDVNDVIYVDAEDEKKYEYFDNDGSVAQKEWYIDELHKAMMGIDENEQQQQLQKFAEDPITTAEPILLLPPPEIVTCDAVSFYDPPPDGNCLFNAFLYAAEHHPKVSTLNITSSSELRSELMDYLCTNRHECVVELLTWEELALSQKDDMETQCLILSKIKSDLISNDDGEIKTSISTLEEYAEIMKINTPFECCWGGPLEINLLSSFFAVNIVIYEDDENDLTILKLKQALMKSEDRPTIHLLHTNDHTHYKAMFPLSQYNHQALNNQFCGKSLSDIKRELIDQLITELQGMKLEDLKSLYSNVSESLKDRNGLVADFNALLTSLLSCNTNSLFLGSIQQSKGALFYIGPYICKNGVQIIDSFDLLIEAQDYALKYPSTAEDSSTNKRFVQYIMTRVINKMNSLMEISDTQAAAALLGMDAGMCSDIFTSFDANSHMQYVYDEKMKNRCGCEDIDEEQKCLSCEISDDDESVDSFIVHDDTDAEDCEADEHSDKVCHQHQGESIMANDREKADADCLFKMSGLEGIGYLGTGYCPIYKVDEGKRLEAVPNTMLYRFRGIGLRKLSRYEYFTQVKVVKRSDNDNESDGQTKSSKKGRSKAKVFEFSDSFELQPSHVQMLRLKLCTLKLFSNPPPFPGKKPSDVNSAEHKKWQKKADRFGAYFLVLFRPEEDLFAKKQTNDYSYDWHTFLEFQNELKNGSLIQKMRYRTMEGYMFGWRTNWRDRAILSHYRGRNRTIWSNEERDEAYSMYGKGYSTNLKNIGDEEEDDDDDNGKDMHAYMHLTSRQQLSVMKNVSFSDDLANFLQRITNAFDHSVHNVPNNEDSCHDEENTSIEEKTILRPASKRFASEILEKDTGFEEDHEMTECNNRVGHEEYSQIDIESQINRYLAEKNLSNDKSLAVKVMQNHFMNLYHGIAEDYEAPVLLITGGPGVGKSFLVDVFDSISKILKVGDQLRMALYGVAAVNIDGTSMLALMDIPTEFNKTNQQRVQDWSDEKLRAFKQKYDLDKISVIIIDEISTVKPYMLGYLNARLQAACCSDKPFGGKAVVFLGDFDQLPPVGSPSIPEVAMMVEKDKYLSGISNGLLRDMSFNRKQFELTSVVRQGVEQFTRAIHINLTEQHRSEDQEHTDLLNRMSHGDSIGPDDLKHYKTLSVNDKDFEFATILTPGNRERHEFNNIQSRRWAIRNKTHVVRWPRKIKNWKGKPSNPLNVIRVKEQESCFWELFIPDALAYLTFNLNVDKGLANGVEVKYDSISFQKKEDQIKFESQLAKAHSGEMISLEAPPDFVNVELFADFPDDDDKTREKNKVKRDNWKFGTITNDGRIVIPIDIRNKQKAQWKNCKIRGAGGFRIYPSTVELADHFPIEPGFSVTIHKAQGRTIRRVILSLSEHPEHFNRIKWEGLYVALSRVRVKDDVRLLLRNGDRSTMKYIIDLKKNNMVKSFFRGYVPDDDSIIDAQNDQQRNDQILMKWDAQLAAEAAGFYIKKLN